MFSLSRSLANVVESRDSSGSNLNEGHNHDDRENGFLKKPPLRSLFLGKRRAANTSSSSSSISPSTPLGQPPDLLPPDHTTFSPSSPLPPPYSSGLPAVPPSSSYHPTTPPVPPALTPSTLKPAKSSFLPFIDLSIQRSPPPRADGRKEDDEDNDDLGDGGGEGGLNDDDAYGGWAPPSPPSSRFASPGSGRTNGNDAMTTTTPTPSPHHPPRRPPASSFLLGLAGHGLSPSSTHGNVNGHASSSSTSSASSFMPPLSSSSSSSGTTTTAGMFPGVVSTDFAKKMEELGRQRRLEAQLKSGIIPSNVGNGAGSSAASISGSSIGAGSGLEKRLTVEEPTTLVPPLEPQRTGDPPLEDLKATVVPEEDKEEDDDEENVLPDLPPPEVPPTTDDDAPVQDPESTVDEYIKQDTQDTELVTREGPKDDALLDPDFDNAAGNTSDSSYIPAVDLVTQDDSDNSDKEPTLPTPPPTDTSPDPELLRKLAAKDIALQEAAAAHAQLQVMVDNLQRDLRAARLDNARLATLTGQQSRQLHELQQARSTNARLSDLVREQTEEARVLRASVDEKQARILKLEGQNKDLQRELATMTTKLTKKDKEEREWDLMHLKLGRAERQLRALDSVTRFKAEAKLESAFVQKKRWRIGPLATSAGGGTIVTDIIRVMNELNEEILQVSSMLAEFAERGRVVVTGDLIRAQSILGTRLSTILKNQSLTKGGRINLLMMQVVLEVFFVHWCVDIIEAHYPKRPSFADLLIEVCAQPGPAPTAVKLYVPQPVCGRQTNIIPPPTPTAPYTSWAPEVTADLARVLATGGMNLRTNKSSVVQNKITQMLKIAYDLRIGLAEKDNLGGLELKVVAPDTLFQKKFMDDAHPDPVLRLGNPLADFVLGTASIGLQQDVAYTAGPTGAANGARGDGLHVDIIMKPKVILPGILSDM